MKKSFRQTAFEYRKQLSAEQYAVLSAQIAASTSTLLQTFKPCTVGLFYPTRGEPGLLEIMGNSMLKDFRWALPVCCESSAGPILQFAEFTQGAELEAGQYSIPVPLKKTWLQPDILIVPCLAFHRRGARLGYGAGWYDRTFGTLNPNPLAIGVAYSATEMEEDFSEPHDRLLDHVVTERAVIHCRQS